MRSRAVAGLIALSLAAGACAQEAAPDLAFARVSRGDVVQVIAAPATIEPRARTPVTVPLAGDVEAVLVADGDRVEPGDPILRLSSDALDAQIAQAQAAVDAAGALSGTAVAFDLSPLLTAVRGQLEAVVPDLLAALAAQAEALPEGEERDQAVEQLDTATESYHESRSSLLEAEEQARASARSATAAQRNAAAAQRRQAEVALQAAEARTEDLVVAAPVAGVVELGRSASGGAALPLTDGGDLGGLLPGASAGAGAAVPIAPGATVGFGQVVATIFDLSGFHVRADVDEIDAVLVDEGQAATILVDAYPDVELRGTVQRVAISPDRGETGGVVFPVRVGLPALPDGIRLRVGLTASVEVEVLHVTDALVVPSSALLRRGGQEVVFVAAGEVVREVPVDVAAIGDDTAAVSGDLEPGDRVATRGVEDLTDGLPLP